MDLSCDWFSIDCMTSPAHSVTAHDMKTSLRQYEYPSSVAINHHRSRLDATKSSHWEFTQDRPSAIQSDQFSIGGHYGNCTVERVDACARYPRPDRLLPQDFATLVE